MFNREQKDHQKEKEKRRKEILRDSIVFFWGGLSRETLSTVLCWPVDVGFLLTLVDTNMFAVVDETSGAPCLRATIGLIAFTSFTRLCLSRNYFPIKAHGIESNLRSTSYIIHLFRRLHSFLFRFHWGEQSGTGENTEHLISRPDRALYAWLGKYLSVWINAKESNIKRPVAHIETGICWSSAKKQIKTVHCASWMVKNKALWCVCRGLFASG